MSTTLASQLEQISSCAQSISELPFPGPRRFTNAILSGHDITALLRDTQAHERGLFHLAPPEVQPDSKHRIAGVNSKTQANPAMGSRSAKNKAVAAVLGGDLYYRVQQRSDGCGSGEVDVELLLHGAEKLAGVYPIAGATERIAQLRRRHRQLEANIAHYEKRTIEQREELDRMNITGGKYDHDDAEMELDTQHMASGHTHSLNDSNDDIQITQDEIHELEQKKRLLEQRVHGLDRDLKGPLK